MGKKIRTRFPMARIKKIMQSDEDVGKVAQATPTLELFLQKLVERAVVRTQAKGARVLSVAHLKQCIMEDPQFDFLKDAVQKVPDAAPEEPAAGPKRSKVKKLSSSTASLMSSQEDDDEDDGDDEEEEDEDEDEEEDEERKPKRPAKKPRKAAAQPKRHAAAPVDAVMRVNPQPAVAPAAAVKAKEEVPVDDRPAVITAGLVATPLTSKLHTMDDDYDMAQ